MRRIYLLLIFCIAVVSVQAQAKYVFYFIGDGMGVNQIMGTEMYMAEANEDRIGASPLVFSRFPVASTAITYSSTNSITDSAAGGTALSSGEKTFNGSIGINKDKSGSLTSIAEMAKRSGKKVGVTTSVSVDHATPAAFYAHQPSRKMYYEIAMDLPKADFDFYAGSGFLKPTTTFEGNEAPSIFSVFEEAGYTIARGYNDFKSKASTAKKMIMIQEEGKNIYSLPYAIDRADDDLTLAQITESAISFLTKNNNKGFFLMVEGGKIDWACHDNDAATAFEEVIDMDNAVKVAYEFYKKHPKETLIVISADHETGGMTLGIGGYYLNLKALSYQTQSTEKLSDRIKELRKGKDHKVTWEEVKSLLGETMGFWSALPVSWEQEKKLRDCFESSFSNEANIKMEKSLYAETEPLAAKAKEVMSEIARIGWSTGGHTAGFVPVYAIGAGAERFNGVMENTEIAKRIAKIAGYK